MEAYEHRVYNGLLKAGLPLSTPGDLEAVLSGDVEIVADASRLSLDDLWPAVWALASAIERQFSGTIYIDGGLDGPLPAPARLGPRVRFGRADVAGPLRIGIGVALGRGERCLHGDARGNEITFGQTLASAEPAHPVACFALAGYLGYAALATAVGIPPFHEEFARNALTLPIPDTASDPVVPEELAVIGLGQLGQAYVALLYFLDRARACRLVVIDKDAFELPNRSTQVLLDADRAWEGEAKADFLAANLREMGWDATGERVELTWGWRKPAHHPRCALLGLDNFDARRIAASSDYDWVFEAGLGTSFLQPKVTWHSSSPGATLRDFFPRDTDRSLAEPVTEFERGLKNSTPGGCGWVTFSSISASAPSMGLAASAYLWTEVIRYVSGNRSSVSGSAFLWTSLLPYSRSPLP
jgi:molybdopterin/thiamine biosynthesis adenylyltransferase